METKSKSGGVFLLLIGGLLCLSGAVFCALMWGSFSNAMEMRSWTEVEAEIISAEVVDRKIGDAVPTEYAAKVSYGYFFKGQAYTSDKIDYRGTKWSKEKAKAEELGAEFSSVATHPAWVNPEKPSEAVLKLPTKAAIYSIWFPGLFFIGGLGIVAAAGRKLIRP